jgi:hypothetical protein
MKKSTLIKWMSLWPPFLGAGIRVKSISADFRQIEVEMGLRFWNRNYVGTHFGGSLYAMTDPFYMLMLIENLGRDYIVWDKSSSIQYKRPGRGTVRARFELSEEQILTIKQAADDNPKTEHELQVEVKDEAGIVVARVTKLLHVRKKSLT